MDTTANLNASFAVGMLEPGNIAFFSQSGALCTAILDESRGSCLGFSHFVSLGNKVDVDEVDFIREWSQDSNSGIICGYLEGVKDGSRFLKASRDASREKPVVLLKAGTTAGGKRAATSHTGTLAGSEQAYDAAFKQCGIVRVRSLRDMLGVARSFAKQPLPQNGQVAVVTNAGGCGILAADAVELSRSLKLASFSLRTQSILRDILPAAATRSNPVDVLGDARANRFGDAIEAVLSDESVGSLLVILTPQAPTQAVETAELIGSLCNRHQKPCFASFMGGSSVEAARKTLEEFSIPNFREPCEGVVAIDAMVSYRTWRESFARADNEAIDGVNKQAASDIVACIRKNGRLSTGGFEARDLLKAYNIPMPTSALAESAAQAVRAAAAIGFPVVLKIASPQILHKSSVGGVALNLKTPEQVEDAFELMMHRIATKRPDAQVLGCQVLPMVQGGREVIVGLSRDKQFGHLLMFGLGGVMVEGLKDVTFRITPVSRNDCREMIYEIRGANFLKRAPGIDIDAVVDVMMRVSQLAMDFPDIEELDINPLAVYPPSQGASSLDMRLSLLPA